MSGKTMRAKKNPIFWDRDAVKEGKSSLQVVFDWLSTEINYNKWRGSDRNNGNTKEALLKEIVSEFKAAQTGSGITSEATLRGEVLKRCPYYFKLADVFDSRPSARPSITSDGIDEEEEEASSSNSIVQRGEKRPLALDDDDYDAKHQKKDPVEKLLDQQLTASKQRAQKTNRMLQLQETKLELKQREIKLKEEQANVDLVLKRVQLETAQRDAVVQLVLARKQLLSAVRGTKTVVRRELIG
ncbi:hypothetical protein PHYSODRAFT_483752 [Phytophthora sojae]|uniref:No apical meristem-associated C-terminal domain-containing protein n=1 Tax=Phytophthora sojae (strain P6497) TaxID=1094619 RepID=G4YWF6_PHYSP|nr:hypothetical protein PHYSODRAFT_483752 [Phytophthora sojae]EGZ25602.1 hypothetical protein PHYSODRAFT_483752 [Phytophthora sojae]|eukprot:XP_009520890.1 hypothetical protein PHYSODRAFT_483752 [Phytophthora sojae]